MIPQTTDNIAALTLQNFDRPVAVAILPAGQTWKVRQQIQYEALKGLMKEDFHGLDDFEEQLDLYSKTNQMILTPAFTAIRALIPLNRKILQKLTMNSKLGMWVGRYLTQIFGFEKVFAVPTEILEDNAALKSTVSI